jgi:hypothetical protein
MKTILCSFVLMLAPAFAQYKIYSDWEATNESGVQYRWVVDDLYPRACTIQFRDLDKDGASMLHASVSYRNFKQVETVGFLMPVTEKNGESAERILLRCTFLDHVEVKHAAPGNKNRNLKKPGNLGL